MQSTITFQGENIESITKTMMQVYLASLKWNILQCLKQPITHAALAINSVIDSETQFTVRKGRLFFSTQHKLCSNSILKSVDIELQIGDILCHRRLNGVPQSEVFWASQTRRLEVAQVHRVALAFQSLSNSPFFFLFLFASFDRLICVPSV